MLAAVQNASVPDLVLLIYALGWLWQITMGRRPETPPAPGRAVQRRRKV